MIKFLLELFFFYILYKIIFEFIIPVYNASRQMSRKMNEFQQQMRQKEQQFQHESQKPVNPAPTADSGKDYIDFEEVK